VNHDDDDDGDDDDDDDGDDGEDEEEEVDDGCIQIAFTLHAMRLLQLIQICSCRNSLPVHKHGFPKPTAMDHVDFCKRFSVFFCVEIIYSPIL